MKRKEERRWKRRALAKPLTVPSVYTVAGLGLNDMLPNYWNWGSKTKQGRKNLRNIKIKCGCVFQQMVTMLWQHVGFFSFSWRTQTSAINLPWLTNYITLPFITWAGRLSVNTEANQYALIFLGSALRFTLGCELSFQAVNWILHHCPPLRTPAFSLFIYLVLNKSNWFPTVWIISLFDLPSSLTQKVTPVLGYRAALRNTSKSYISSPAHSK